MNDTVRQAILNTPVSYLADTLKMRNPGPEALGSQFLEEQSPQSLMEADWQPYEHPAIAAPAKGFRAEIPGLFGLIEVGRAEALGLKLQLVPSRKGTGFMEVTTQLPPGLVVDDQRFRTFSVALVGPGDDGKDVLWTVFPGEPVPPSVMPVEGEPRVVSAVEAKALGFELAKVEYA